MASVRETRKIAVEEAPVPALGGGLPVEEAIDLQALDAVSVAASDDGHPKADTLSTFVQEQVGPSLRCTVPILLYAVAVAVPTLCVHVPLTGNVILPVASANVTLASMSSASAHGYLEAEGLFTYMQFLFVNVLVLSFIKGQVSTMMWYSVNIMNVANAFIRSFCWHSGFDYSLNQYMMSLCLAAFFILIQLPLNFGIVHFVLQKYAAGSLCWHIPLCTFCVGIEMVNIVFIKNSTAYLQSELFQWTAPFVLSFTAIFTRRAAEWSVGVPPSEASKMSTVSLGLGPFFTRLAQSALINSWEQVLVLEVFYNMLNIVLRTSLYQRHAIFSLCSRSGTFKVRGVQRRPRAQSITTVSNITEAVFDTALFIVLFVSRFLLLPSSITTTIFIILLCVCIVLQTISSAATFLLVSHYEDISIKDFSIAWTSFGDFGHRWIYLWSGVMWATTYMGLVTLSVWDPSIRYYVPWK